MKIYFYRENCSQNINGFTCFVPSTRKCVFECSVYLERGLDLIHIQHLKVCPSLVGISEYERSSSLQMDPPPQNKSFIFSEMAVTIRLHPNYLWRSTP